MRGPFGRTDVAVSNLTKLPYTMWFKVAMFSACPVACKVGATGAGACRPPQFRPHGTPPRGV